jgi:NAD(P)H dehydrogenase (quinone)
MADILVLYYSRKGSTEALAREVCRGVDAVDGMSARLRTVPAVSAGTESVLADVPESGPPYATMDDLRECAGLVMGSPTNFGNMAASLKYFIDRTVGDWFSGILIDKPAGVFTSSASLHGGQESTLLTMALPLIHHGMVFVGLPYSEERLTTTTTGGTPYGATHVSRNSRKVALSDDEKHLARALGRRVATFAARLGQTER